MRRGATCDFSQLLRVLDACILIPVFQPNPIHSPNISVTSCPLGDNPQILNVPWNLTLCILFQTDLLILECSKPKQATIFDLNHMPLLALAGVEGCLAKLIEHLKPSPVLWCLLVAPDPQHLTHALHALAKVRGCHVPEHSLMGT